MHRFFLCFRGFLLSGMFSGINVEAHAAHGRMAITIRMFERRSPETKETYAQGLAAFYVCQLPSMLYLRYSICCLCSRLHLNVCDLCVLFLTILSRIHLFIFSPPCPHLFLSISSAAPKFHLKCRIQVPSPRHRCEPVIPPLPISFSFRSEIPELEFEARHPPRNGDLSA